MKELCIEMQLIIIFLCVLCECVCQVRRWKLFNLSSTRGHNIELTHETQTENCDFVSSRCYQDCAVAAQGPEEK